MDGKIRLINQTAISQMQSFVDKQKNDKNSEIDKSIMPQSKETEAIGENVTLEEINALKNTNNVQNSKGLNYNDLNSIKPDENIEKYLSKEQKELIIEQFEKEYEKLLEDFETAKNSNGLISKAWDKIKNFTKLGAGSDKTLKQIENLKKEIENLKKNPDSFSESYENITGSDLTLISLNETFNEAGSKTNASKSLEKYTEGQKMAVDTFADIVSGIAAVGTVAAASAAGIVAAPFTAGASLSMIAGGFAIAGTTGAAVKTGVKALDCVGNEKKYSLKNAAYDTITGAANGMMSIFSAALGGTAGKAVMKTMGKEALETTALKAGETAAKQTGKQILIKTAGAATEMTIDGGLSGMADALSRDIGENITGEADKGIKEIAKDTLKGTVGGVAGGVLIGGAFKGASKLGDIAGNSKIGQKIGQKVQGFLGKGINKSAGELSDGISKNLADGIDELSDGINKNITDEINNAISGNADELGSGFDYDSLMDNFGSKTKTEITQGTTQEIKKEGTNALKFLQENGIINNEVLQNADNFTQKELDSIVKLNKLGIDGLATKINTGQFDNAASLLELGIKDKQVQNICKETSIAEADEIINFAKKIDNNAKINVEITSLGNNSNTDFLSSLMLGDLDSDCADLLLNPIPEAKSGNKIITTTAEFSSGDDCIVQVTQTINPDGSINIERSEKFVDGVTNTKSHPKYNSWSVNGNNSFQTTPDNSNIGEQFEIIYDKITGEPSQILHTKQAANQGDFFNKTLYNLKDYSEDIDIIEAIKSGELEGGEELSKFIQNPDGSTTYFENIQANGSTIKRDFTRKNNGVDYDYSFKINDENGKQLLNIERSFEQISPNETKTVLDGKEITALFDDSTKTITLKDSSGKEIKIDIGSKIDENKIIYQKTSQGNLVEMKDRIIKGEGERLWESCKNLPADTLYQLDDIEIWKFCDDLSSAYLTGQKNLVSGENSFILSHELGHYEDELLKIRQDTELKKLYQEELSAFNSSYTNSAGKKYIDYFSQTSKGNSGGLAELIAETNALLKQGDQQNIISTRAQLLAQNFPKTISFIAKKLKIDF